MKISRRVFIAQGIAGAVSLHASARGGAFPRAEAVTSSSAHYFFGYYDKCPWDITGRYLLACHTDFLGRQPKPGEEIVLGAIDLTAGRIFKPIAVTSSRSMARSPS